VIDVCDHKVPSHVVNRDALAQPVLKQWFAAS